MSCDRPEDCRNEVIQPQVGQRLFEEVHRFQLPKVENPPVGAYLQQHRYGESLQMTDPYPKARQDDHIQGSSDGRHRHSKR